MTGVAPLRGLSTMWEEIRPLLLIGAVCVQVGLRVFRRGEECAKKHEKLQRPGWVDD